MLKRYSILFFILLLIGFVSYNIFVKFGENVKFHEKPVDYFPENPGFFMVVEDFSKTLDHFSSSSMIWSSIADDTINNKIVKFKQKLNEVVDDSICNKLFLEGNTFFAFYNCNGKNEWLIVKNIFSKEGDIYPDSSVKRDLFNSFYLLNNSPFLAISSNDSLLQEFNSNYRLKNKAGKSLKENMSFSSKTTKISCLLNISQLKRMNVKLFETSFIKEYIDLLKTKNWIQFDINYNPKEIEIIGISDEENEIKLPAPNYFSFSELLPDNIEFLSKKMVSFQIDTMAQENISLQTLSFKFMDNIQNKKNEILIIENPVDSGFYSSFLSKILLDSMAKNMSYSNYRMINRMFLKDYFNDYSFNNKYAFSGDYCLIISSIESKKELDYMLAHKSQKKIDKAILDINNNKEYDQAQSLYVYQSKKEINEKLYKSNLNSFLPAFFNSISGISWSINNFSNRVHHGISIKKSESKKSEKNILWKLKLPTISWGPYTLKNHRTGTKDIVVLDTLNTFYLIGANGKIKWSKSLSSPIIGKIKQIDAYKNNKYQMIFNTQKEVHILDVLGNEIDDFPIKLPYNANNEIAVFDYDNNNDYRFILAAKNGVIYNYNLFGERVEGWKYPKLKGEITHPLTHFAINGKDYIFSLKNNGKLSLLNRKGEVRYSINNTISSNQSSNFYINKSFTIDSSSLIFEDTLGGISEFKFSGFLKRLYTANNNEISLNYNSASDEVSYYSKTKNNLKISDLSGQTYEFSIPYVYEILRHNAPKNYTILLNKAISELQLIDAKYRLHPTLFRGSSLYCLDDINNDKYKEMITVVNETVLVCYQVPALK